MTLPEIELIRAFNKAYRAENLSRRLYTRVMRFGASAIMEVRPPEADEPKIELPAWSLEKIGKVERQIIDGIRESGVRVIGDPEALAYLPPPRIDLGGPVTVSPQVAASAAMGVLIAAGLARGAGQTRANAEDVDDPASEDYSIKAPPVVQEPMELLRLSTSQLVVVLLRRGRAALVEKISPLLFWRRR
jgi:hypothetical protein